MISILVCLLLTTCSLHGANSKKINTDLLTLEQLVTYRHFQNSNTPRETLCFFYYACIKKNEDERRAEVEAAIKALEEQEKIQSTMEIPSAPHPHRRNWGLDLPPKTSSSSQPQRPQSTPMPIQSRELKTSETLQAITPKTAVLTTKISYKNTQLASISEEDEN